MRLSIISFTANGMRLSKNIAAALCGQDGLKAALYTKYKASAARMSGETVLAPGVSFVEMPVGEWAQEQMQEKNTMLFIGACGIAVRAVAPYLTDKLHDGPVLVMDEQGNYVIPILSGHMGGANEIARYLGRITGAAPVITTATDINDKFAVDLFARENGLFIVNKDGIAKVSAKVLRGEKITMSIAPEYEGKLVWRKGQAGPEAAMPVGVCRASYPPAQYVDIVITSKMNEEITSRAAVVLQKEADEPGAATARQREESTPDAAATLHRGEYIIGFGCRKGKDIDEIDNLIREKLSEYGVKTSQVSALASISIKSGEQGIVQWCRKENIPFLTYTAEELRTVEGDFVQSAFVTEQTGVDNVCERAALRACGKAGRLICRKYAKNGMTFALARR